MAPQSLDREAAALKDITNRLNTTAPECLPHITPVLANGLLSCEALLCIPSSASGKTGVESEAQLHKFKTRLSSLLQDRSPERRWSAVVLVKTAIELGGWEMLSTCSPWVMNLRAILSKADSPATKKLVLITLTRIFLLTREYPSLLREITTPALPEFISRCMSLLVSNSPSVQRKLTDTLLSAFSELIPRHPATFRPHVNRIREAVLAIAADVRPGEQTAHAGTITGFAFTRTSQILAQRVLSIVAFCAPKEAASEWERGLLSTVHATHQSADRLFRAVIEEWESTTGYAPTSSNGDASSFDDEVQLTSADALGLTGWRGINGGSDRMVTLLGLLTQYIVTSTPGGHPIALRVGPVLDLLNRIFSITVPTSNDKSGLGLRPNRQIDKHERQALWTNLPSIHVAALELVSALIARAGSNLSSMLRSLMEQVSWIFDAEQFDVAVRIACYSVSAQIIGLAGSTMQKSSLAPTHSLLRSACTDLLRSETKPALAQTNGQPSKQSKQQGNADALFNPSRGLTAADIPKSRHAGLAVAARTLLYVALTKLDSRQLTKSIRALLDRTVVLAGDEDALTASVLSTQQTGASLMPMLARGHSGAATVDGILRPRMPVISTGHKSEPRDDPSDEQPAESPSFDDEKDEGSTRGGISTHDTDSTGFGEDASPQEYPLPQQTIPPGVTLQSNRPPSPKRKASPKPTEGASEIVSPSPKRLRIAEPTPTEAPAAAASIRSDEEMDVTTVPLKVDADVPMVDNEEKRRHHSIRTGAGEEDEDSDDFEIPALEMGVDSDEE